MNEDEGGSRLRPKSGATKSSTAQLRACIRAFSLLCLFPAADSQSWNALQLAFARFVNAPAVMVVPFFPIVSFDISLTVRVAAAALPREP